MDCKFRSVSIVGMQINADQMFHAGGTLPGAALAPNGDAETALRDRRQRVFGS